MSFLNDPFKRKESHRLYFKGFKYLEEMKFQLIDIRNRKRNRRINCNEWLLSVIDCIEIGIAAIPMAIPEFHGKSGRCTASKVYIQFLFCLRSLLKTTYSTLNTQITRTHSFFNLVKMVRPSTSSFCSSFEILFELKKKSCQKCVLPKINDSARNVAQQFFFMANPDVYFYDQKTFMFFFSVEC